MCGPGLNRKILNFNHGQVLDGVNVTLYLEDRKQTNQEDDEESTGGKSADGSGRDMKRI